MNWKTDGRDGGHGRAGLRRQRRGRGRAQHLQLGRLHQPGADQEVRGGPQGQGDDHRLRLERHGAGQGARRRPRLRHRRALGQLRADLGQGRPAARGAARPDGELQERRRALGGRALGSGPPLHRAVAVGRDRASASTPRSIPATSTPRPSCSTRRRNSSARSTSSRK